LKAFQAIYGSSFHRLEGNFSLDSTIRTDGLEHFPRASVAVVAAAILSAILATLGFVFKPFFMIKLLFSCGKYEILSTVLAH
jgi:hypothetical protein